MSETISSGLTPVVFASHGSPLMCFKESSSSEWWTQFGKEALANDVKGVVFIGAHWEELGDRIGVATKFDPGRVQMEMVPRSYWENYPINVSADLALRVIDLLRASSFRDVEADPTFDWHDDTITPARWMFPNGTPPATVISLNARFNPVFHVNIGRALSALRKEGILIVGTGGAVHNLYRNNWIPMLRRWDNFQPGSVPAKVLSWPERWFVLLKAQGIRDAHPTDDHYYPLLVAAGAASCDPVCGELKAQTWELQHMCNNQFLWGSWGHGSAVSAH